MRDGRYWWTATTSIARKKKVLFFFKHLLLSHLICYIHWGYYEAITTFRENRPILDRVIDDGTEERSLSSRRENRVYTARERKSGSNDWFPPLMIYFLYFTTGARRIDEFRPSFDNVPVPNRGKSRRAPDRINVETSNQR